MQSVIVLPIALNCLIVLVSAFSILAAAYLMASAQAGIRIHLPQQFRSEGQYRWHLMDYAFDHSVPYRIKRAYVLSGAFGVIFFIGAFLIAIQTKRGDAMVLLGIVTALGGVQTIANLRKLRATKGQPDEGRF
ncbi:hypothetical protein [Rhizobium tubonense]|uniref:SdpI family protein n=1 Tax=Rhizobium tubonense TaxID=484088 RepID=A0A2W4EG14_9HYPH|nr:hypothetical protein [Rhizobium tubonense]PZM10180.1 hypothetical protein CPY51_23765 [Rhizobium tubonense]